MAFEYIPGETTFHKLDPRSKLMFFATYLLLTITWGDPIFQGIALLLLLLIAKWVGVPRKSMTSFLKSTIFFVLGFTLITMLTLRPENPHILFWLFSFPFSLEVLVQGAGVIVKMLCMLLSVYIVLIVTPIPELVLGLVKIKLPVDFGIATATALSYVPVLMDETEKIREALESRGRKIGRYNIIQKFKVIITEMFVPAVMISFKRAGQIAIAMESKGLSYNIANRTFLKELKMTRNDYICIAFCLVAIAFAVLTSDMFLGYGSFRGFTLDLMKKLLGIE